MVLIGFSTGDGNGLGGVGLVIFFFMWKTVDRA